MKFSDLEDSDKHVLTLDKILLENFTETQRRQLLISMLNATFNDDPKKICSYLDEVKEVFTR